MGHHNNLHINTEKTTTTLFTPDPAKYGTTLSFKQPNTPFYAHLIYALWPTKKNTVAH